MARTARVKKTGNGTAYYHLMSRTNDKRFLFDKGRVKTQLIDALKRAAAFSGVEIDAYVAMDNHFHVVCKVVRAAEPIPEVEIIRRVAALKGERAAEDLVSHWKELREIGMDSAVAEAQDRLRARMNDISEFMKTFKEMFNAWYKRDRKYTGTIWSGRFTSTLVEGGRYRAICMRYVYLNPVRAGMVAHAYDYAWSWIAAPEAPFAGPVGARLSWWRWCLPSATDYERGMFPRVRWRTWALQRTDGVLRRGWRHEIDAQTLVRSGFRGVCPR